jgi:uncharacterized protein (DUF1330 family)
VQHAVAQLSIHDRARYDRYASRLMRMFAAFDGRLLAADEGPRSWRARGRTRRSCFSSFPDRSAVERWAFSPEDVEISKDRIAATTGSVLLVSGIPEVTP